MHLRMRICDPAVLTILAMGLACNVHSGGNGLAGGGNPHPIVEFSIPTPASQPWVIVAGPDGNLWFTEWLGNNIGRITTTGTITEFAIPSPSCEATSIAPGPDSNLWFTEQSGQKIGRITTAGVITEYAFPLSSQVEPAYIAAGPDGTMWFTENMDRLGRITMDGIITEHQLDSGSMGRSRQSSGSNRGLLVPWLSGRTGTSGSLNRSQIESAGSQPREPSSNSRFQMRKVAPKESPRAPTATFGSPKAMAIA
jgi:streptogramin lyase